MNFVVLTDLKALIIRAKTSAQMLIIEQIPLD